MEPYWQASLKTISGCTGEHSWLGGSDSLLLGDGIHTSDDTRNSSKIAITVAVVVIIRGLDSHCWERFFISHCCAWYMMRCWGRHLLIVIFYRFLSHTCMGVLGDALSWRKRKCCCTHVMDWQSMDVSFTRNSLHTDLLPWYLLNELDLYDTVREPVQVSEKRGHSPYSAVMPIPSSPSQIGWSPEFWGPDERTNER